MSYVITAALFSVIGFIGGLLVFRKNQDKINDIEKKAEDLLK